MNATTKQHATENDVGDNAKDGPMNTLTKNPTSRRKSGVRTATRVVRPTGSSVGRLVRRLERERRTWARAEELEIPTAQAWRAGVAEGLRLAQVAIRKGV